MSFFSDFPTSLQPFETFWWIFSHGGFVFVLIAIGYGVWWLYMDYIQGEYVKKTKYILLAIDVPKENEQTPKAVEHMFSHFHGIQKGGNLVDKYVHGLVQPTITVELISIGGYIQYIVRAPAASRDLVESAVYAQYPNAEITEVEDYTNDFPATFPNNDFQMWGAEIVLASPDPYPIKTYPLWEHSLTQTFLDPLASVLEIMNRLQEGEQIWIQLVLSPTAGSEWRKKGLEEINKLIGAKAKKKVGALDALTQAPGAVAQGTWETLTRTLITPAEAPKKKDDNGAPNQLQYLPPNVRAIVEGIGIKISKIAFTTKFRVIYLAKKDIFNGGRVGGVLGALKQFNTMDLNGFRPSKTMKTTADYFFVEQRVNALRRKILRGYKNRSLVGGKAITLNIEELASVWHFPVITVKAPAIQKSDAKRGEPPVRLPIGDDQEYIPAAPPASPPSSAPGNLPTSPS